jgi:hypothetical protein
MNATISYSFELPEDEENYRMFLHAEDMHDAIENIRNYLRQVRKYSDKDPTFDEVDEKISDLLSDIPWV